MTNYKAIATHLAAELRIIEHIRANPDDFDVEEMLDTWTKALSPDQYNFVFSPEVDAVVEEVMTPDPFDGILPLILALFGDVDE